MRFLITGIGGFAGRHLASLLVAAGHDVHGSVHRPEGRGAPIALPDGRGALDEKRVHVVDVTDAEAVDGLVRSVQADGIFHLAGLSFVPDSHADPTVALRTNLLGAVHLFAAVRRHRPACRVVSVGSADAYGLVGTEDIPITESCPFRPLSPYGASKAAVDLIAFQWARGYGLDIVRMRPFNHTGPGQRRDFVCPDFASQVVAIERGLKAPVIEVGNLDVVRDFSDVRDVVQGYLAAWERGTSGEAYNVCSGVGRSVREVLETMIDVAGIEVRLVVSPERVRPVDVPVVIGSAERLRSETSWRPRHDWRQTLADVLVDRRRQEEG
jgi:GDP-4-dehydro-6-deoxy-D-mannose reductase